MNATETIAAEWFVLRQREDGWVRVPNHDAARCVIAGRVVVLAEASDLNVPSKRPTVLAPKLADIGPNGRRLCRWCHREVEGRRIWWCGQTCVNEYASFHNWGLIRHQVWTRDRGVCSSCGVDTMLAREWARRVAARMPRQHPYENPLASVLLSVGWPLNHTRDWWEADHIHARYEGGHDHPTNLRTLCVPCHKARTRDQAGRRAAARRDLAATLFRETP